MEYFIVVERTILFYILIAALYRFMGKREIGQLGVVDLIVSLLIAELAAMSIDKRTDSVLFSILPIISLVGIQILSSYLSLKSSKIRNIFDGKPSLIINKGIINFKEMIKQRYNLNDLLTQLRGKDIKSIDEVNYAILESSGNLSVFKKEKDSTYPLPIIMDGTILNESLKAINKNLNWINNVLKKDKLTVKDIFYAYYKKDNLYIIKYSDLKN